MIAGLGPHAPFIIAAYAMTAFILTSLTGWIALDYSEQQRKLVELERRGIQRRSAKAAPKKRK